MTRYTREQAERTLLENSNMPDGLRKYFEAVRDGTLPQYYREEVARKRDEYSDELPNVDVRTLIRDQNNLTQYKCQGNYVVGLCLTLRGAMADGVVTNGRVQRNVLQFLASDLNFQVGDPLNNQRIQSINGVLNAVLGQLG